MIRTLLLLLSFALYLPGEAAHAEAYEEAPRIVAALEQGRAAEQGIGIRKNFPLAIRLYCDAGTMGSPEGFFRVGRILAKGPRYLRNPRLANAYLALAIRLGNHEALEYYDESVDNAELEDECGKFIARVEIAAFDLDAYLAKQPLAKQKIAAFIRSKARQYGVDVGIALGIALAESNLNANAVSPKNAQGVMQLIPSTQKRFGVTKPFDPEHNVIGGLAYLSWLQKRFGEDWRLVAAAYNAGEGAVDRYGDIPPYPETQQYVRRVLYFAGFSLPHKN